MNQYNQQGEKHGYWEITQPIRNIEKVVIITLKGNFIDGEKDGVWREYYSYKITYLSKISSYENGVLHGSYQEYWPDGQVKFCVTFNNDFETGIRYNSLRGKRRVGKDFYCKYDYQIMNYEIFNILKDTLNDTLNYYDNNLTYLPNETTIEKDNSGNITKIIHNNSKTIICKAEYSLDNEIIYYEDFKGNFYNKSFGNKSMFKPNDLIYTKSLAIDEIKIESNLIVKRNKLYEKYKSI